MLNFFVLNIILNWRRSPILDITFLLSCQVNVKNTNNTKKLNKNWFYENIFFHYYIVLSTIVFVFMIRATHKYLILRVFVLYVRHTGEMGSDFLPDIPSACNSYRIFKIFVTQKLAVACKILEEMAQKNNVI